MSSRDKHTLGDSGPSKRQSSGPQTQKVTIACDHCLKLQIRCKFNPAEQDKCRGCTVRNTECVWTKVPKPRPLPDSAYIEYLEGKVKETEAYLKRMFPGINAKREIDTLLGPDSTPADIPSSSLAASSSISTPIVGGGPAAKTQQSTPTASTLAASRLVQQVRLANIRPDLAQVDANDDDSVWDAASSTKQDEPRYHGQSSSEALFRDASMFRNGYHSGSLLSAVPTTYRRKEFWQPTIAEKLQLERDPWETEGGLSLELPPDDLLHALADAFFKNTMMPIIHRPSFEKQLEEGLHKRSGMFLRVVLLVCANGARWYEDPRALDDRWPVPLSAGYRWFRQFEPWHKTFVDIISLQDAQIMVLSAMYLFGSSASYGTWTVVGMALRKMQDVGIHRKKSVQSLENELYKRCFWSMIFLDRLQSISLGRHGAIQDVDFDLDDPLEIDDEYWSLEPNAPPPKQPQGVPSKLSMFKNLVGLCRVAGRCLQTVFALERTKRQIGLDGPQGSEWMFKDINAHFNLWAQGVPSHLQLPGTAHFIDTSFFADAVALWGVYFDLVISTNQTFVTKSLSPLAAPSLKICREAARSCANMLDAHRRVYGPRQLPASCYPAFSSAMTLVVDLIAERKLRRLSSQGEVSPDLFSGSEYTVEQKEEDMRKCMQILADGEKYFHIAGRLHDMIREFEESWRLQISPSARSTSSSHSSGKDNPPGHQPHKVGPSTSTQPLPFQPCDTVLPALPRDTPPSADAGTNPSFEIAYHPPDTTPAFSHSSHPSGTHDTLVAGPVPDYDYASHAAYADDMFAGLSSNAIEHVTPHYQVGPTTLGDHQNPSERGLENHSRGVGQVLSGLQPYMPEYGYTALDAHRQHARRLASTPSHRMAPMNMTPAVAVQPGIPTGFAGFPSGGWMSAFSEPTNSVNRFELEGQQAKSGASAGPPGAGTPLAPWDMMMHNALNLTSQRLDKQPK